MEEQTSNSPVQQSSPFLNVPTAIIIAGILIAGSVVYSRGGAPLPSANSNEAASAAALAAHDKLKENIKPVSAEDHIFGDPKAPVKIVEYSDTECPFCKRFQLETMAQVMKEYGASGKVAWVYRQAPLDSLHTKARAEAEATECVAKLAGNAAFWNYLNNIFVATPANNGLDPARLLELAAQEGVDQAKLIACAADAKIKEKVQDELQNGIDAGLEGTPFSVIVASNGKKTVINGAQSYETVKPMLEKALAER